MKVPKKYTQTVEEATHKILCRHQFNIRSWYEYYMDCIILKEMSNNRLKIIVFGDRAHKNSGHIRRIRYVYWDRVSEK